MFKAHNIKVGLVENMAQNAQDMSAQLAKIKASDADTLIVTTAVEQLTLVFKQAAALGLKRRIITTGGSQVPDQLIEQAGGAVNGTSHIAFFAPWNPELSADPARARALHRRVEEARVRVRGPHRELPRLRRHPHDRRGHHEGGQARRRGDSRRAFWNVELTGLGGKIKFNKVGPAGMESGQSVCDIFLVRIENGKVVVPKA